MNKKIVLLIIMIVATILRFYQLGKVPVSLDWDEVAIGYNAYSLIQTGRDEFGVRTPLVFRSFDDYKPPLYIYLTVPSVYVFGLNEFAVRFPSAFFGTLTILLTYLFMTKLLEMSTVKKQAWLSYLPLTVAGLLAISPWHVHFSRVAFEANVGIFFNVLGIYLFLKGLQKGWYLFLSATTFALALYEYHSERVFVPLLAITLTLLYRKELIKKGWSTIIAMVVGVVIVMPLVFLLLNPSNLTRLTGTSSLADKTGLLQRSVSKIEDANSRGDLLGKIFANRRITYGQVLLNGYLSPFDFNWLFVSGDQERHHAPGMGLMYWWELPFLLAGIYVLASSEYFSKRMKMLIFAWILIAPVAASPTTELPHAIRTLVFLPMPQVLVGIGLLTFWTYLRNKNSILYKSTVAALLVFILFNFAYYMDNYYVNLNLEYSKYWQYGYKEAVQYTKENYDKYDQIVVSQKLEQPYIFFLFYLKYPPKDYLAAGGTRSGGFAEQRNAFGKYQFRTFDLKKENLPGKTLYIGTPKEIIDEGLHKIKYLDQTDAIKFYETEN